MELAYSAKEREVERELGNMRNQFTEELKNIASRWEIVIMIILLVLLLLMRRQTWKITL